MRKSVRAIGRCAIKIQPAAERCVDVLLDLIHTKVNYVVQEAIVVIKDIFRKCVSCVACPHLREESPVLWFTPMQSIAETYTATLTLACARVFGHFVGTPTPTKRSSVRCARI